MGVVTKDGDGELLGEAVIAGDTVVGTCMWGCTQKY